MLISFRSWLISFSLSSESSTNVARLTDKQQHRENNTKEKREERKKSRKHAYICNMCTHGFVCLLSLSFLSLRSFVVVVCAWLVGACRPVLSFDNQPRGHLAIGRLEMNSLSFVSDALFMYVGSG